MGFCINLLAYLRFWVVKTLIRSNPLVLFVGSPLYVLYLRALGAKIGRGVAIFSRNMPVCTDLLTIGEGTVIRKDSYFTGYRAHAGLIETGAVTLGRDALVGEATVIDIGTSMGDGAQLGHTSSLHTGQAVPYGERWHGSPAQRTDVNYRAVDPTDCGALRRALFPVVQLLGMLVLSVPLAVGGVTMLAEVPQLATIVDPGTLAVTSWTFYGEALAALVRALLRLCAARPARCVHCSSRAQPRSQAGQGLSLVWRPLLDPPGDRAHDQYTVLHAHVR